MIKSKQTSTRAKLHYIEGPNQGLPLLLLHGSTGRLQSFNSVLSELQNRSHVFALDLRGHGQSERTPGHYTMQDHVEDVVSFIENTIKEPTIIFGHSYGGMIAIVIAALYPHLCRGIIAGDAFLTKKDLAGFIEKQKPFAHQVMQLIKTKDFAKLESIYQDQDMLQSTTQCDPDMIAALFDRFEETAAIYQVGQLFPLIKCPTLILCGNPELGGLITEADIAEMAKAVPHLEAAEILNAGHMIFQDKENVLQAVEPFIENLSSGKGR